MDTLDAVEMVYKLMRAEVTSLQRDLDLLNVRRLRAETAGGVPASTVAALPHAASGGLSDGTAYVDLRWASNGLKPGETAGAGTGCLVSYAASTDQWVRIGDYVAVTA